jgi:hypothetical protein
MTKQHKDQPRDGNGKFAKMIRVEDKYGNVAYFTPEEMRGFKVTPKNPDCETATRGYVKDLMRKTRNHTHVSTFEGTPTIIATICGWFFSIVLGVCYFSTSDTVVKNVANQYFVPVLLFTIVISCVLYDLVNPDMGEIKEPLPSELQKYTPPRKDECEGE